MGVYNILFYFTHVATIVIVANIIFWLKDIDPRFREGTLCTLLLVFLITVIRFSLGEDSNFHDVPTLVEHKQRLMAEGKVAL